MNACHLSLLEDRGAISVTGPDAKSFLDNLITNDMDLLASKPAIHAALLTPQGKILFEFFVVPHADGYLLETARKTAPDLVKRLTLYRLRAKVTLNDLSASRTVIATWGGPAPTEPLATSYADPRHGGLGVRLIVPPEIASKYAAEDEGPAAYATHRISLGVPEAGLDYALGDTFPHEADFDLFAGVSFTKGCFVGQEVVARMQHKTVVRKRVARVTASGHDLASGAEIKVGEATIGIVGSTSGPSALALLRLDRASEALAKGMPIFAAGTPLTVDPVVLAAYDKAAASRSGA
ncbi:MAG: folate-binding protein YgfZ [Proteobacteria bacterium]|nr:folate-binding protein YgfZ [Pseudomonadota bacterium]